MRNSSRAGWLILAIFLLSMSACGIYSFNDVSIPPEVKTVKIGYIENKARYINPRLSSQITDAFVKKVASQTKLIRKDDNNADYVINGTITNYDVTTSGVSANQASLNRLTVGVHLVLIDNTKQETKDYDVSSYFDFNANLSVQQAENTLMAQITKDMSEAMFNKVFSNW